MANYKTWSEQLKDPRWQKKRLEIMERDKFRCRWCLNEESTLTVHHSYYEKGLKPWEYPNESLVTLCEECHRGDYLNVQKDLLHYFNMLEDVYIQTSVLGYLKAKHALIKSHFQTDGELDISDIAERDGIRDALGLPYGIIEDLIKRDIQKLDYETMRRVMGYEIRKK
ncbi:MAG: HNH endonuclease [Armatimonadota bacterium]